MPILNDSKKEKPGEYNRTDLLMKNFAYIIITVVYLIIINSCKTCECPAYSSAGDVKATSGVPKREGVKAKQKAGYLQSTHKDYLLFQVPAKYNHSVARGIKHAYLPTSTKIAV